MPKKYSLVQDGPHALTLHDGENHFQVAKKGLTSAALKKVMSLPKYADGGEIPDQSDLKNFKSDSKESSFASDLNQVTPTAETFGIDLPESLKGEDASIPSSAYATAASAPPVPVSAPQSRAPAGVEASPPMAEAPPQPIAQPQAPATAPVAPQPVNALQQYQQGIAQQEAGIKGMAGAEAQKAKELAAAYPQYTPQEEKAVHDRMIHYQNNLSDLEGKMNESYQAAMQNKEDPNRVWNNASTGNKILAAIGIMFGAAGQHATGGQNMALNTINKAIDDDIHAQRNDTANKNSLYARNLQQYRDTQTAMDATRLQMQSIAQGKLAAISAKYGGPEAQAQAQQMLGHLKAGGAQDAQRIAYEQAKLETHRNLAGGNGGNINPELLDKETRERVVNTPMGMKLAYTKEDATKAKEDISQMSVLNGKVKELMGLSGANVPFSEASGRYDSIHSAITTELNKLQSLNRLTHEEMNKFEQMVPSKREALTPYGKAKMSQLLQDINEKTNSMYSERIVGAPQQILAKPRR